MARWGDAAQPTNAEFAVQPSDVPGNSKRVTVPSGPTTISFDWREDQVKFRAGAETWTYAGPGVPAPGAGVHMNLWLEKGHAPTDGQPVEVVIREFTFRPGASSPI